MAKDHFWLLLNSDKITPFANCHPPKRRICKWQSMRKVHIAFLVLAEESVVFSPSACFTVLMPKSGANNLQDKYIFFIGLAFAAKDYCYLCFQKQKLKRKVWRWQVNFFLNLLFLPFLPMLPSFCSVCSVLQLLALSLLVVNASYIV